MFKKILILFFCCSFITPGIAQLTYSVNATVNGCKAEKIYLSKIYGKQVIKTDSSVIGNDCRFSFILPEYIGVVRLSANDSNFIDVIINHENVCITFPSVQFNTDVDFSSSPENIIYYQFLKQVKVIEDSADILIKLGQKLYDENPSANASKLNDIMKNINRLKTKRNEIALTAIDKNKDMYASKLIKAYIVPDYSAYKKNKDAAVYPSEAAFLKEHYFDYTDFSDSTLLNSDIFYKKCGEYFDYFASPPSVDSYNKCIDFILVRAQSNKKVYEYIINTLLSSFEHTQWEDVMLHIAEKYNETSTCSDAELSKELNKTSAIINSLKKGHKAYSIVANDLSGKNYILDSLKSKYILVMFWASWCDFCEDAMPELKAIYNKYNTKGLEIFAVSCDSVNAEWQKASAKYGITWINTCDLKGFKSENIKNYYVWQTPAFYLLDKDKKIISKPITVSKLKEDLGKLEW
ncbi:MAG TPA: thioredoxin-like domain-containing protein [Bacteroidales bacterium]|nr:thioredoxin-like domain-containing protein [Bacteroidales bacterium]HPS16836.1 thioredoxin-like domain-containing protein [Bacteroidales bacterium]